MQVEIVDEPMSVQLAGASAERRLGFHMLDVLRPLSVRLWEAINARNVVYNGLLWMVNDGQGRVTLGVECVPDQGAAAGLEELVVTLPRYAASRYSGEYDGLFGAIKSMRSAIMDQQCSFTYPWVEIYVNWDGGAERVEAELLHAVVPPENRKGWGSGFDPVKWSGWSGDEVER